MSGCCQFLLLYFATGSFEFSRTSRKGLDGKELIDTCAGERHVDEVGWGCIQAFADKYHIVQRMKSRKTSQSPSRIVELEKEAVRHMGQLKRGLESQELQEENMSGAEETHVIDSLDNGNKFGANGDNEVQYADVTSGKKCMTLLFRLSGGPNSRLQTPFLTFKN